MELLLVFIAALLLAWFNGANDNFKGVATLFGSDTTNYKNALSWATITTLAGSVASVFLAGTLVKNFSGKGLVPDQFLQQPEFAAAVALGAAATVMLATFTGMPISTTHSIVGALAGAGIMAVGMGFNFGQIGKVFLFPLLVSPFMAAVVSYAVYLVFRKGRLALGVEKDTCVCLKTEPQLVPLPSMNSAAASAEEMSISNITVDSEQACARTYQENLFGISAQSILDGLHYLSAGVVSFARGLNDTPKIVGLILIIQILDIRWGMAAVAVAMAVGGLLNAKKVAGTMSKKITDMNSGQGFTANLVTGVLVTTASIHGMPVSTTHVSVGSLFGIGTAGRTAKWGMIRRIILSWVLTLPVAALLSAVVYLLLA